MIIVLLSFFKTDFKIIGWHQVKATISKRKKYNKRESIQSQVISEIK